MGPVQPKSSPRGGAPFPQGELASLGGCSRPSRQNTSGEGAPSPRNAFKLVTLLFAKAIEDVQSWKNGKTHQPRTIKTERLGTHTLSM